MTTAKDFCRYAPGLQRYETHAECSRRARNATPCNASHTTFGGRCLNCGWRPEPRRPS